MEVVAHESQHFFKQRRIGGSIEREVEDAHFFVGEVAVFHWAGPAQVREVEADLQPIDGIGPSRVACASAWGGANGPNNRPHRYRDGRLAGRDSRAAAEESINLSTAIR